MKNFIVNLISFGPVLVYTVYALWTKEPNSGIDWSEVTIATVLGIIGSAMGKNYQSKGGAK